MKQATIVRPIFAGQTLCQEPPFSDAEEKGLWELFEANINVLLDFMLDLLILRGGASAPWNQSCCSR